MNFQFLCALFLLAACAAQTTTEQYVQCLTSQGEFTIKTVREWAPNGVDHFMELVNNGFYTNIAMYRTVPNFITQFGISDDDNFIHYHGEPILDDPSVNIPFAKYTVSFAGAGPDTRTTQMFIILNNYQNFLGAEPWEVPIGTVVTGKTTLKAVYGGYGDFPPYGNGPVQSRVYEEGSTYLQTDFPLLDYIYSCGVVEAPTPAPSESPTTKPTKRPSAVPSPEPSFSPTEEPTEEPTFGPTEEPTEEPTEQPAESLVFNTAAKVSKMDV